MGKTKILSLLLFVLMIAGCAEPLPQSKLDYAGDWRAEGMQLLILKDGSVAYHRLKKGAKVSINGPLKEWQGDSFVVGIWLMTSTFEVSEPPHQEADGWYMTVDGVKLKRLER